MARRRNSDSMCTYASRLRSESGIGPEEHTNSTRSSLSYLEACLLGRTDFTSIAPCANTPNESTLWNHRINPELTQLYCYSTRDFAEDGTAGWFTNGLETHVHLQVQSQDPTQIQILGQIKATNKNSAYHATDLKER